MWTGAGSGLLISMLEKLVSFDRPNNTRAIDVKMNGFVLEEKSSFKMLGLTFSSKLDWGCYIISIAKKMEPWFVLWSFFLLRLLCSSINLPYAMHGILLSDVWAGAPSCYLELLDKLQKWIWRTVHHSLIPWLKMKCSQLKSFL